MKVIFCLQTRDRLEKIKITSLVGLGYMIAIESEVSTWVLLDGPNPRRAPLCQFGLRHKQVEPAVRDVERYLISIAHQRERSARVTLRGNVKNTCAVCRATHARVGYAHHVANSAL